MVKVIVTDPLGFTDYSISPRFAAGTVPNPGLGVTEWTRDSRTSTSNYIVHFLMSVTFFGVTIGSVTIIAGVLFLSIRYYRREN
jgi:hypothetical protein